MVWGVGGIFCFDAVYSVYSVLQCIIIPPKLNLLSCSSKNQ